MAPENVNKGFWEGGSRGHGTNKEASGRPSGFPGSRTPGRPGLRTDIEFPDEPATTEPERQG